MECLINIKMDNAAFDGQPLEELERILRTTADRLPLAGIDRPLILRDINGSTVGYLTIIGG